MNISKYESINIPLGSCRIEKAIELLEHYRKVILDKYPDACRIYFESEVEDNYGSPNIIFRLSYKRNLTDEEVSIMEKRKLDLIESNKEKEFQQYLILKKQFEDTNE